MKWFIPGIHYDVLVVHTTDVYADEAMLVVPPEEACEMAPEWLESAFRGDRDLHDVLDELGLASMAPELRVAAIQKAFRNRQLVALKLSARTTALRRIATCLADEARERDRREAAAREAFSRSLPRTPPSEPAPEAPLYRYAVRVIDDTGAPVVGIQLKLDIEGTPKTPLTDANGLAATEWFSKASASVRLSNQDEVARQLEPRWLSARASNLPSGPNVSEQPVDSPWNGLSITAEVEHTLILTRRQVRRVRLVGMLFDANRCFLLPQSLPGVRTIVGMHRERPKDTVLVVGHAGGDERHAGMDLALARAEILGAYLTSNPEPWMKCFDKTTPSHARWGLREVQLMLSVLPNGKTPHYQGNASGVSDSKTTRAIKAFQKANQLTADGRLGPKTMKAILAAYMDLEGTTLGRDIQPVVHGCEGHFEDTETEDGVEADDRRLEVFFFAGEIVPKPDGSTSLPGANDYPAWRNAVVETRDFEHHGIHVQIVDGRKRAVPFADVHLEGPTKGDAVADEHGFVSFFGLLPGEYVVTGAVQGRPVSKSKLRYPTAKTVSRETLELEA